MSGNGKQVQLAPGQTPRYACVARPHTPQRADAFSVPPAGVSGSYAGGGGPAPHLPARGVQGLQQPPAPPQQELKQAMNYGQAGTRPQGYPYRGGPPQPQQMQQRPTHHRQQSAWPAQAPAQQMVFSMGPVYLPSHMQHSLPPAYQQQAAPRAQFFPQPQAMPMMQHQQQYYGSFTPPQGQQPYMYSPPSGQPSGPLAMGAGRAPAAAPGGLGTIPSQAPHQLLVQGRYPLPHTNTTGEKKRRIHAIAIVDPKSGKDVVLEDEKDSDLSERAPPQPDENSLAAVVEFTKRVTEAAKEVDVEETQNSDKSEIDNDIHVSHVGENNVIQQSFVDVIGEIKHESDLPEEKYPKHNQLSETPVVSAISNSPEIVPKQSHIVKQKHIDNINADSKKYQAAKPKPNKQMNVGEIIFIEVPPPKEIIIKEGPTSPMVQNAISFIEDIPKPEEIVGNIPAPSENKEEVIEVPPVVSADKTKSVVVNIQISEQEIKNTLLNPFNKALIQSAVNKDEAPIVIPEPVPAQPPKSKQDAKKKSRSGNSDRGSNIPNKIVESESIPDSKPSINNSKAPETISNSTENKETDEVLDALPVTVKQEIQESPVINHEIIEIKEDKLEVVKMSIPLQPDSVEINDDKAVVNVKADVEKDVVSEVIEKSELETAEIPQEPAAPETIANETEANVENSEELINSTPKSEADSTNEQKDKAVATDKPVTPLLRYSYREDQWSPLNTSGKKCYDVDFLLMLRNDPNSKKKPENISQLEIVADPLRQPRNPSDICRIMPTMRQNDLLPGFARSTVHSTTPNRKSQHGKPNSKGINTPGSGLSNRNNIINVNLSLKSDVKLNETQNAWKPARMRSTKLEEEEVVTLELYRTFRSVLNKLTPQKFDTLISKVRKLNIDTKERLIGVINLVFEKAIDEPNFSVTYALMCKELETICVPDVKDEKPVNFRSLIIGRCQAEFEKEDDTIKKKKLDVDKCTDPEKKLELIKSLEEEERRIRQRSVGNVRFIGELFKQNIIVSSVIIFCINRLLKKIEEETLECLCKLLSTIGKDLEVKCNQDLQSYFNCMKDITELKDNKVSSRVRFMLQDVIDLRQNSWIPRQLTANANPKTMDQIKLEVEMEQKSALYSNFSSPTNMARKDDRPNNMNKRGGSKSVTEDGWSTASSRNPRAKQTPYVVDPGKLRMMAATPITLTSLQPSTQFLWGKGSTAIHSKNNKSDSWPTSHKSGGNASNSSRKPATETSNMYLALDNQSDGATASQTEAASSRKVNYRSKGASIERSMFKSEPEDQPASLLQESTANKIKVIMANVDSPYGVLDKIQTNFTKDEMPLVVRELILWGLDYDNENTRESTYQTIQMIGDVTGRLVDDDSITSEEFLRTLKQTMDQSSHIFMKGNLIWKLISAFIWSHMKKNELSLKDLHLAFSKVIEVDKGFELLTAIFLEKLRDSQNYIKTLWDNSAMELSDWMSEDNVEQFLEEFPLKWLQTKGTLTPEEVCSKMLHQMQEKQSRDVIKEWVDEHVKEAVQEGWFIRSLTEAIHTYALCPNGTDKPRFDETETSQRLSAYYPLLNTYIASQEKKELECLFAIQNLMDKMEHPQGITLKVFEYIWEYGEIISFDGFVTWEKNKDPHEQKGKGVMLKTLTSFFTALKSVSESSDETASVIEDEY